MDLRLQCGRLQQHVPWQVHCLSYLYRSNRTPRYFRSHHYRGGGRRRRRWIDGRSNRGQGKVQETLGEYSRDRLKSVEERGLGGDVRGRGQVGVWGDNLLTLASNSRYFLAIPC
jgi:hypothetical protein